MIRSEFLRFLLTGSANTAASWLLYLACNLVMPYTVAYTLAYVFGIVFTYYLNTRWVFKVKMQWRTFLQFPMIYVVRYGMDLLVIFSLVHYWQCPESVAPLLAIAMNMPLTFIVTRLVLKNRPAGNTPA